ncbi:unnamed protein product [Rhizophagus irregularis]|nr:unnamed protein product [Rhizophagus irregularis]
MWELTTGCKPFANVEHDICEEWNKRNVYNHQLYQKFDKNYISTSQLLSDDSPDNLQDLRKRIYDKRIFDQLVQIFNQAELKRNKLINSKKLGPNFSEKSHPKAIYTSRLLSSYISKCSSIFSKCSSINFSSNDYISNELEFDIDIKSNKLDSHGTKRNIEESNINSCENNGKRIKN